MLVHFIRRNNTCLCLLFYTILITNELRLIVCIIFVEVKVKCTLVHTQRLCTGPTARRCSRSIPLLFLNTSKAELNPICHLLALLGAHRILHISRLRVKHGAEGDEWSASRPGLSLHPGKTRYPLYRRLRGPQGWSGQVRKISPPPGFDTRSVQPVASRYTDYSTRPTYLVSVH